MRTRFNLCTVCLHKGARTHRVQKSQKLSNYYLGWAVSDKKFKKAFQRSVAILPVYIQLAVHSLDLENFSRSVGGLVGEQCIRVFEMPPDRYKIS